MESRATRSTTVADPRTSLALWLRAGRAQRKLTIDDVARVTKIQPRILEKLETGQLEGLPAEVFVRGFVKSFARCVGLDESEAVERYGACAGLGATPATSAARAFVETLVAAPARSPRAAAGTPPDPTPVVAATPVEEIAPFADALVAATPVEEIAPLAAVPIEEIAPGVEPSAPVIEIVVETAPAAPIPGEIAPKKKRSRRKADSAVDQAASLASGTRPPRARKKKNAAKANASHGEISETNSVELLAGEIASAAIASADPATELALTERATSSVEIASTETTSSIATATSGSSIEAASTTSPSTTSASSMEAASTTSPSTTSASSMEAASTTSPSTTSASGIEPGSTTSGSSIEAPWTTSPSSIEAASTTSADQAAIVETASTGIAPSIETASSASAPTGTSTTTAPDTEIATGSSVEIATETGARAAIEVVDHTAQPVWQPTMPPIATTPSVPWKRPTLGASTYVVPTLVIDDADPELADREREERDAARAPGRVSFLPPILLERDDKAGRQGGLTLAVILLLIAATLTLSYLMRRPGATGDGVTQIDTIDTTARIA